MYEFLNYFICIEGISKWANVLMLRKPEFSLHKKRDRQKVWKEERQSKRTLAIWIKIRDISKLMVSNTQIHTSLAKTLAEILMYVWGRKSLRSALNNFFFFFISEIKKSTPKNDGSMSKKKKQPTKPAQRASHWPNLGQFEDENNYNKSHNLLNKIGIHEY